MRSMRMMSRQTKNIIKKIKKYEKNQIGFLVLKSTIAK